VKNEEQLPYVVLKVHAKEQSEKLLSPVYASMLMPSNQVAARRIAKHLYMLGNGGTETSLVDYVFGLCSVDLNMVMCGYMYSAPSPLPAYRKARMQNALANIESNLRMDGRLFEHKLTIAEFAIFETQFWLTQVFGRGIFRDYPKIMETVNLIRNETKLQDFMRVEMEQLEANVKSEIDDMVKYLHLKYPERKQVKVEDDVASKRNSVLLNAFYAHMEK